MILPANDAFVVDEDGAVVDIVSNPLGQPEYKRHLQLRGQTSEPSDDGVVQRLARIPVLDGARFLLIPAMGSRSLKQDEAVLNRGKENGVPIVEANVGVTLIVDDGQIVAVDRKDEGITFADITIPPPAASQDQERDRVEKEFLQWREREMKVRLEKTLQKLPEKQAEKAES